MHYSANQRSRSKRSGFTLVELLVVIAIIATLVAISAVAYSRFQLRAKSVVSASNLRQWGQALVLYTTDSNGMIPYEGDRDNFTWAQIANAANETSWFNVLPPYVGGIPMRELNTAAKREEYMNNKGIHYCPLVRWRDSRRPTFAFMMNSQIYNSDGPSNNAESLVRMARIQEPSITVMFADLNQSYNTRARGRGRHVDERQPGRKVNLVFFDGSLRTYSSDYITPDNYSSGGVNYTENNRPDVVWNPWIHPRTR